LWSTSKCTNWYRIQLWTCIWPKLYKPLSFFKSNQKCLILSIRKALQNAPNATWTAAFKLVFFKFMTIFDFFQENYWISISKQLNFEYMVTWRILIPVQYQLYSMYWAIVEMFFFLFLRISEFSHWKMKSIITQILAPNVQYRSRRAKNSLSQTIWTVAFKRYWSIVTSDKTGWVKRSKHICQLFSIAWSTNVVNKKLCMKITKKIAKINTKKTLSPIL
jgi:hypothetical protein